MKNVIILVTIYVLLISLNGCSLFDDPAGNTDMDGGTDTETETETETDSCDPKPTCLDMSWECGSGNDGCGNNLDCPDCDAGLSCSDLHECEECTGKGQCGPSCVKCEGELPTCVGDAGVDSRCECEEIPLPHGTCNTGRRCESGDCIECIEDFFCGSACGDCSILNPITPVCFGGIGTSAVCECTNTPLPNGNCGTGRLCDTGTCIECVQTGYCGPTCEICQGDTPICLVGNTGDDSRCIECDDGNTTGGDYCSAEYKNVGWHTFYGGTESDRGYSTVTDSNGNIYITGFSANSWNGPGGEAPLNPHGTSTNIFVLKLNSTGEYKWHTFYGSNSSNIAKSITIDNNGNIYITGYISSYSWNGPGNIEPKHVKIGIVNIVVLKLNSNGIYQWHAFWGEAGFDETDEAHSIITDSSGNVYIAGRSSKSWNGPGGETPKHARNAFADIIIMKINSQGDYQWHTYYGSNQLDKGTSIVIDTESNIFISGQSASSWNGPGGENPKIGHCNDNYDSFILKLSSNGVYLWHTFLSENNEIYGIYGDCLSIGKDGDVYKTGFSESTWKGPGDEDPVHSYSGDSDMYVAKFSSSGTYQWHTFFGSDQFDIGSSVVADKNGHVYVTGYSSDTWNGPGSVDPVHTYSGNKDITVIKLDTDGAYKWHTFFGGSDNDEADSITIDNSGNLVISGYSKATWNGPAGKSPLNAFTGSENDIFVLKLAP